MKYKKKPIVVEAFQYGKDKRPSWFLKEVVEGEITEFEYHCEIKTLEGTMVGNANDWIIKGINDEIYPCKPDIFEKTYEVGY